MQAEWDPDELIGAWTLLEGDWDLIANKAGVTRLGFAVMLKFLRDRGPVPRLSRGGPARSDSVPGIVGEGRSGVVRQVLLGGADDQVPPRPDSQGVRDPAAD